MQNGNGLRDGFLKTALGGRPPPAGLSALIAAGAADFVADAQADLPAAAACVEKRLQTARRLAPELADSLFSAPSDGPIPDFFGEILRHELNNPLRGILGDAELLLAAARRQGPHNFLKAVASG